MTRFYSETEIKKQNMKLNEDLLKNPEKLKEELKMAINAENHRSNVDSAKKSAVSQYMDYDGFHQMVLGADLKGMKMDDVINIKPEKGILNPVLETQKLNQSNDIFFKNFIPNETNTSKAISIPSITQLGILNEELTLGKLKRKWMEFTDTKAKINYLSDNVLSQDDFNTIINKSQLDVTIFGEFILHFGIYIGENINDLPNREKVEYVYHCLEKVIENSTYAKLKMFIGKKQKNVFEGLVNNATVKEVFPSIDSIIEKIIK